MADRPTLADWRVPCVHYDKQGNPCDGFALRGGALCARHGGSSKKQLQAANDRLAELKAFLLLAAGPDAVESLHGVLSSPAAKPADIIRASTAILDRVGLGPSQTVVVEQEQEEAPIDRLLSRLESIASRKRASEQ